MVGHQSKVAVFFVVIGSIVSCFAAKQDPREGIARKLISDGKFEEAARELKKILSEDPKKVKIFQDLANIRIQQGKYNLAIMNFKFAKELDKKNVDLSASLAKAYEGAGQIQNALKTWREFATLTSEEIEKEKAEARILNLVEIIKKEQEIKSEELRKKKEQLALEKEAKKKKRKKKKKKRKKKGEEKSSSGKKVSKVKESTLKKPKKGDIKKIKKKAEEKKKKIASKFSPKIYEDKDFILAKKMLAENKNDEALKKIKTVLKKIPGHPGAYYLGGEVRFNKNEYKKALFNFEKGLSYPEKGFNGHYFRGRIYMQQNDYPKAIKEFKKYIRLTKNKSGKKEAQDFINQMEKNQPLSNIGKIQNVKNIIELKLKSGGSFFNFNSGHPQNKEFNLVKELLNKDKMEKGLQTLKKISRKYGSSPQVDLATLNLAMMYQQMGLSENAARKFKQFLKKPLNGELKERVAYELANALHKQKQNGIAKKVLLGVATGKKYGPTKAEKENLLSQLSQESNEIKKAINHLSLSVKDNPEINKVLKLGILNAKNNNVKGAISTFKKGLKFCDQEKNKGLKDCITLQIRLADLYFQSKNYKQSLRLYQDFNSLNPDKADASWSMYQIGNIYKQKGKDLQAIKKYKELISSHPESYWSKQAKWQQDDILWRKEYQKLIN